MGPRGISLLVLVIVAGALCAAPTIAHAGDPDPVGAAQSVAEDSDPAAAPTPGVTEWCVRGEPERPEAKPERNFLSAPLFVFTATLQRGRPPVAGSRPVDAPLCVYLGIGSECQVHDPAKPPSPSSYRAPHLPDLATDETPELPAPTVARAPLPPGVLGAARPGHAPGPFRPPCV